MKSNTLLDFYKKQIIKLLFLVAGSMFFMLSMVLV